MYQNYSYYKHWKFELLNYTPADYGGLHHAAARISGDSVYKHLKYEGGIHRVQRIPDVGLSSRMQRIHTGTMSVIVLLQPDEVDVKVDPRDLRIDTFRSRGPGGQHVNTTDSAVRLVHIPTGLVVECQQERSQLKNKEIALRVLRARLYQQILEKDKCQQQSARKLQVGTRAQSERIRTYNFTQDRVTDHRIAFEVRDIKEFLREHDIYLAAQPRKDLWVYKPAQNSWHQLADRLLCREGMDVAYLNGYIYILGGRDPITGVKLKEVECYSVQRNQWALVAPVPHSFYSFELIVVQNYLYAVNSKRMLCYDPSHNMWLNCASLKRSDFQEACVFKDEIYCICDIPVMKVYNPARGEWRRISNIPLDSETHNYQIVNHDQKLLLITSTTPQWKKNRVTVYEYDTREDQWINIGTMLGLLQFDSGFICLCARVYPSCLEPGQSFITEEDDARTGVYPFCLESGQSFLAEEEAIPSEPSISWDLVTEDRGMCSRMRN
ncbi:kelch repeat and BTB (POZ) domain containing 7 [Cricetulus griseus]